MTTLLQKLKIHKSLNRRKNLILGLTLAGFKLENPDTDFKELPITMKHKTDFHILYIYLFNVRIMPNYFGVDSDKCTDSKTPFFTTSLDMKEIKKALEKINRVKELREKQKIKTPF